MKNEIKNNVTPIIIHWWNNGKKTLDFEGQINAFLKEKEIKVRRVKHPKNQDVSGYSFTFKLASIQTTITFYGNPYEYCAIQCIKTYTFLLGDKATIKTRFGRLYQINF